MLAGVGMCLCVSRGGLSRAMTQRCSHVPLGLMTAYVKHPFRPFLFSSSPSTIPFTPL